MARSVSLADKCLILFGAAVAIIVIATMLAPWALLSSIADASHRETARRIAAARKSFAPARLTAARLADGSGVLPADDEPSLGVWTLDAALIENAVERGGFIGAAARALRDDAEQDEFHEVVSIGSATQHRSALAIRGESGALREIVIVQRTSTQMPGEVFTNRLYVFVAGVVGGVILILAFYLIMTKLILRPVRSLRETAERVEAGGVGVRAEIQTGDEFEQLADAFNTMLEKLEAHEQELQRAKASLDMRVAELAERNLILDESARLKGDFLANVSHELRTPLNSIIGFAELLQEILDAEAATAAPLADESQHHKRRRYLQNIVAASRSLLEMINELLSMAKIEAGRVDLHVETIDIVETCGGLLAMIRPQAERKKLTLTLDVPKSDAAPGGRWRMVETDPQKLRQIVFNFLSNAVKFTPEGGEVTVRVEGVVGGDGEARVRVSALDTGPGIAAEDHERIFEKFTQLDAGHTRTHPGTGLGLAICRELAEMIQGELQLVSEPGRGSMFSVVVPVRMDPNVAADMTLRTSGKGPIAARGSAGE